MRGGGKQLMDAIWQSLHLRFGGLAELASQVGGGGRGTQVARAQRLDEEVAEQQEKEADLGNGLRTSRGSGARARARAGAGANLADALDPDVAFEPQGLKGRGRPDAAEGRGLRGEAHGDELALVGVVEEGVDEERARRGVQPVVEAVVRERELRDRAVVRRELHHEAARRVRTERRLHARRPRAAVSVHEAGGLVHLQDVPRQRAHLPAPCPRSGPGADAGRCAQGSAGCTFMYAGMPPNCAVSKL